MSGEGKDRVSLSMSFRDIVLAMAEGNPGAFSVCMQLLESDAPLDLLWLDSLRVYGPNIWLLYKDVCRQNLPCMWALLAAVRYGAVSRNVLAHAIDNLGAGLDLTPYMPQEPVSLDAGVRGGGA